MKYLEYLFYMINSKSSQIIVTIHISVEVFLNKQRINVNKKIKYNFFIYMYKDFNFVTFQYFHRMEQGNIHFQ